MSTLEAQYFFQDFEQDYMSMLSFQPEDAFMDIDLFQQMTNDKGMLIDEIDELEDVAMKQEQELEELRERNKVLKYNLEMKKKVTRHIQSVHGMIFESSSFPMIIYGPNHTILSWNRAAAEFHEYKYEDLHKTVTRPIQLLSPYDGDVEKLIQQFIELRKKSSSFILEFERKTRNGSKVIGKCLIEHYDNGTSSGIILEHKTL